MKHIDRASLPGQRLAQPTGMLTCFALSMPQPAYRRGAVKVDGSPRIMIALLQRVTRAGVHVDSREVAAIGPGLLVLVGVERDDGMAQVRRLAERLVAYRVFADDHGRMNRDVIAAGGELLLVPQFTLAADTGRGNRPGFSTAAAPQHGEALFAAFVEEVQARHARVRSGVFGAYMQVCLCNDGPVTFWLQVRPPAAS